MYPDIVRYFHGLSKALRWLLDQPSIRWRILHEEVKRPGEFLSLMDRTFNMSGIDRQRRLVIRFVTEGAVFCLLLGAEVWHPLLNAYSEIEDGGEG